MKTASGGTVSFKKMGRLDAIFVRAESTNVVLLATHGQCLTIPANNLCNLDRSYIVNITGVEHPAVVRVAQSAIVRNEMLRRRVEAAKLKDDAEASRRAAEIEMEAADELDSQAAVLAGRACDLDSNTNQLNADISGGSPDTVFTGGGTKSKRSATIASGAVAQLQEDLAKLRAQALEKRRKAENLQREATKLEQIASAELNSAPHMNQ